MRKNLKAKRRLCMLLATVCSLSMVIGGCGGKKVEEAVKPAATESTQAQASVSKEELKPVELSWYFVGNGQQDDVTLIEQDANKYLKDKINATIKLHCFDWGSYDQKIRTMISAGEELDICFTTAGWVNDYRGQAAKGAFVPLNDMLDQYAPKTKALLGDDFLTGSKVNGINYAIPANKEKAQQYGVMFLKKYVDKYKYDLSKVKTIEDLEPMLKEIKAKEPGIYPLSAGLGTILKTYFDDLGTAGPGVIRYDTNDMKIIMQEESAEAKAHYQLMNRFYKAGYIRQDAATSEDTTGLEKAGKIFCKPQSLKPGKDKEMSMSTGQEWVQLALTPVYMTNYETVGSMQAISSTSPNPERALMFLELFNTDPYLNNLINFGIEGKHYTKVSENIIKQGAESAKYCPATTWMFGNVFINYLWETEDKDKWVNFKKFNDEAIPSKSLGFGFDPAPVKNELAACEAVTKEFNLSLDSGTLNPDEYLPKYIKALKDAGSDKIMAEKQKQLDAWLSSKK